MRSSSGSDERRSVGGNGRGRLLIVGLDGATFDVILPLVESGRLPTIGRLMESGTWGNLRSTLPPLSPVAWSSLLTGKNPGRHGVFGFERIVPGSYDFEPVGSRHPGQASLWRLLGEQDRRVVALDIPFSYPPEPVNGYLVAGYGAPADKECVFTHPPQLPEELARRFGEFKVAVPRMRAYPPRRALFRKWDHILDNRLRVAEYLMRTSDWDVFMIVLGVTDHIQHATWTYFDPLHGDSRSADAPDAREALFRYYEKADRFIGHLLDIEGGPIHVMVVSDHGFGTAWRGDLTRRILADRGWLAYRGLSPWPRVGRGAIELLHRTYDSMPWLKRLLHGRPRVRSRLKRAMALSVEWGRTKAFSAAMGWHVYLNRRDRFPHGTIGTEEECQALCGEIKASLEAFKLPRTDRRAIRRVWLRDEIYRGEALAAAPDLVVEYENLHGLKPSDAADWDIVGAHAMDGIFIACGPDVAPGRLEGAAVEDVVPTALYLLGLPLQDDFDGRVLADAIRPEVMRARPVRTARAAPAQEVPPEERPLSPQEAESIRRQLRDLGYID